MTNSSDDHKMKSSKMRLIFALIPLFAFAGFAGIAGKMLYDQDINGLDISAIPSALIGETAPALDLQPLEGSGLPALNSAAISGKLSLVNVFASWCVPCRLEHPFLTELAKDADVTLVGINYKDKTENALRFLGELGNPFAAIGVDPNGKAAIDWGVYGIPETFLVSEDGKILFKKIGPIDETSMRQQVLPAIAKAKAERGS